MSLDLTQRSDVVEVLKARFSAAILARQATAEDFPVMWIAPESSPAIQRFLREEIVQPFAVLADLWAIDESRRQSRPGQPASGVTVATHLTSLERNAVIRLKVACIPDAPRLPSFTGIHPNADWYEREAFDMFGVTFAGGADHCRILMPPTWVGHPLLKSHYARATEKPPFRMTEAYFDREERAQPSDPASLDLPVSRGGEN
jgi:NADH-quinone oxidoreductase subunit C/D